MKKTQQQTVLAEQLNQQSKLQRFFKQIQMIEQAQIINGMPKNEVKSIICQNFLYFGLNRNNQYSLNFLKEQIQNYESTINNEEVSQIHDLDNLMVKFLAEANKVNSKQQYTTDEYMQLFELNLNRNLLQNKYFSKSCTSSSDTSSDIDIQNQKLIESQQLMFYDSLKQTPSIQEDLPVTFQEENKEAVTTTAVPIQKAIPPNDTEYDELLTRQPQQQHSKKKSIKSSKSKLFKIKGPKTRYSLRKNKIYQSKRLGKKRSKKFDYDYKELKKIQKKKMGKKSLQSKKN